MTIKQLTVLTGNSVSHLSNVMSFLSGGSVNIRAHCLVDNGDGYCKLRMVVSEPDKAVGILQANKYTAVVNDVVLVETDDKPGGLSRLLKLLEKDDIQIEFSYTAASESPGIAMMVFRFSDNSKAIKILEKNGLKLIKSNA
ncbi:MAG: hypothetical protein JRF38_08735 [Deltaproteobacteria bacterium]|jgi:hypothetical protein|nr:hypothetical protein [Deltaproteobacteria bacterium]